MPTLDPEEFAQLLPAETAAFASPIPTQSVSSDEFMPLPQTQKQKQVEARVRELGSQAKDWPQLNFVIYHSGFRFTGGA